MLNLRLETAELRRACLRAPTTIRLGVIQSVRDACEAGKTKAKAATWKDRTGRTRQLIRVTNFRVSSREAWGFVESPAKHSNILNDGSAPHPIYPKAAHGTPKAKVKVGQSVRARGRGPHEYIVGRGIALRWVEGGQAHFAKMLLHSGSRAFHFMDDARDVARAVLMSRLGLLMKRIEHGWGGKGFF
jgi:hypothetical protein